jgi:hypothetical protein
VHYHGGKFLKKSRYVLSEIQDLVRNNGALVANRKAQTDLRELEWTPGTLRSFLLALQSRHFIKTYPDCSIMDGRHMCDADGYAMCFNEEAKCEGGSLKFFTKVGIHKTPSGLITVVASIHLS